MHLTYSADFTHNDNNNWSEKAFKIVSQEVAIVQVYSFPNCKNMKVTYILP